MTDPVHRDRHRDARLWALTAWAEGAEREIHPERGEGGEASQAIAREMLRRADAEKP